MLTINQLLSAGQLSLGSSAAIGVSPFMLNLSLCSFILCPLSAFLNSDIKLHSASLHFILAIHRFCIRFMLHIAYL